MNEALEKLKVVLDIAWPARPACDDYGDYNFTVKADGRAKILDAAQAGVDEIKRLTAEVGNLKRLLRNIKGLKKLNVSVMNPNHGRTLDQIETMIDSVLYPTGKD